MAPVRNPLGVALGPLVNDCRGTAHDKNCDIVMVLQSSRHGHVVVDVVAQLLLLLLKLQLLPLEVLLLLLQLRLDVVQLRGEVDILGLL